MNFLSLSNTELGQQLANYVADGSDPAVLREPFRRLWDCCLARLRIARAAAGQRILGRRDLLDAVFIAGIGHEHMIIFGPPGSAKTMCVFLAVEELTRTRTAREPSRSLVFARLLNRTTLPDELLGPIMVQTLLREGKIERNLERSMARARMAALEEVLEGDATVLNLILSITNERIVWDSFDEIRCPLISAFGTTTRVVIPRELAAFYDRFLFRGRTEYLTTRRGGDQPPLPARLPALRDDPDLADRLAQIVPYCLFNELDRTLPRILSGDHAAGGQYRNVQWWAELLAGIPPGEIQEPPTGFGPLDEFRFLHLMLFCRPLLQALLGPLESRPQTDFFRTFCRLIAYLQDRLQDNLGDRRVGKIFKALLSACVYHGFKPWGRGEENPAAIAHAFRSVVPLLWDDPGDEQAQREILLVATELGRGTSS